MRADNQTVWEWRKALGVWASTEGTARLRRVYCDEPWAVEARAKVQAKARDLTRRAKIAAALWGRTRPPHIVEAVARALRGKPLSEETRQKMSVAHRRRGTLVPGTRPFTPAEDELVRTLPIAEVVRRTGRTVGRVKKRRRRLHLPDGRRRASASPAGDGA